MSTFRGKIPQAYGENYAGNTVSGLTDLGCIKYQHSRDLQNGFRSPILPSVIRSRSVILHVKAAMGLVDILLSQSQLANHISPLHPK